MCIAWFDFLASPLSIADNARLRLRIAASSLLVILRERPGWATVDSIRFFNSPSSFFALFTIPCFVRTVIVVVSDAEPAFALSIETETSIFPSFDMGREKVTVSLDPAFSDPREVVLDSSRTGAEAVAATSSAASSPTFSTCNSTSALARNVGELSTAVNESTPRLRRHGAVRTPDSETRWGRVSERRRLNNESSTVLSNAWDDFGCPSFRCASSLRKPRGPRVPSDDRSTRGIDPDRRRRACRPVAAGSPPRRPI